VSRISDLVVLSVKSELAKETDFDEVTDKFAVVTGEVQKKEISDCLFVYLFLNPHGVRETQFYKRSTIWQNFCIL